MVGKFLTYFKYIFSSSRNRSDHENNSSNVTKLKDGLYEVYYKIKGRRYKILVQPERGPPPVTHITDNKGEDVTESVLPFMGPQYNWKHGIENTYHHLFEDDSGHIEIHKFSGEKETIYFSPVINE